MVRSGTLNTVAWLWSGRVHSTLWLEVRVHTQVPMWAHTHTTHMRTHARTHTRIHTHTMHTHMRTHACTHARTHAHTPLHIVCTCSHIHVQHTIHRYATLSHKASFVSCLSLKTFKCWDVVFVAPCIISIAVFTPRHHRANNWHWRDWVGHTQIESYTQDMHFCHMTYISVMCHCLWDLTTVKYLIGRTFTCVWLGR